MRFIRNWIFLNKLKRGSITISTSKDPSHMLGSTRLISQHIPSTHNDSHKHKDNSNSQQFFNYGIALMCSIVGGKVYNDSEKDKTNSGLPDIYMEDKMKCQIRDIMKSKSLEESLPGASYLVMVDGVQVLSEGIGYCDVENKISCSPSSVMRIASISKPLTMTVVAKLMEEGKLDLDAPIQKYVDFPKKIHDGKEVNITTRHLLSHTSGIRHYTLKHKKTEKSITKMKHEDNENKEETLSETADRKRKELKHFISDLSDPSNKKHSQEKYNLKEHYIKENFCSVQEAIQLFQDDDLLFEPGTKFGYTTHGWTLVSAVLEGASGLSFNTLMKRVLKELKMDETYLETHSPIIFNRSRQYTRSVNGGLANAPYVNNSYKYAGGGLLSTVEDLAMFGLEMLCSAQQSDTDDRFYLKKSTMKKLWTPTPGANVNNISDSKIGLSWFVNDKRNSQSTDEFFMASHTGGAVGGSSILCIATPNNPFETAHVQLPQGIVVVILTNVDGISFSQTAHKIIETVRLYQKAVHPRHNSAKANLAIQYNGCAPERDLPSKYL